MPFCVDVGTAHSDLTWRGAAGIAFSCRWGDLVAMQRFLDKLQDLNFNGPRFGATFGWQARTTQHATPAETTKRTRR
ncbi:MAG: hypothetical protein IPJ62_14090 [Betaproteobacteria bacterium]|nr:hypothetical protein [Betaproteobacteria bacterium]